ncbi:AAA family ATPase [Tumebacillus permanentifrigoris]|uniref:Putative ATP-binding protein involved in virulence n=1 Tax=Tumebacillus permanentifrigoris TaxID=378543 RepID=A0A316DB35_9BACL|nr:AAA family ATPase [Tumebacillus permanentifrigoris]PWK11234.1 putative ATP-binding protein involved in virulence [Tumebacillus permanentifrigoris]
MKLARLELENYRGFPRLQLQLDGQSAIIIGMNGAGKSTVLDAIATAMAPLLKSITQDDVLQRNFSDLDIRHDRAMGKVSISTIYEGNQYDWGLSRKQSQKNTTIVGEDPLTNLAAKIEDLIDHNFFSGHLREDGQVYLGEYTDSIPITVYYPVHRAVLEIPVSLTDKSYTSYQNIALDDALSVGVNFIEFFRWFRYQEDIENENKIQKDRLFVHPHLQAVREAIEAFLPGFKNLRISRVPTQRMLIDKNGKTLTVNQLSDGEKILLALIGDLARRLALANPGLAKPLEGEGLVLIDEVELHLHPAWQREVINGFQKTFPNVQFIFTTHSPQVVSEVRDLKMYVLSYDSEGNHLEEHDPVFGQDVNFVLEDVMGASSRNVDVKAGMHVLFRLIEQNELDQAEAKLKELELFVGAVKPSELLKASTLIHRKRTIGR